LNLTLLPCASVREYKGGVRRTEGLKNICNKGSVGNYPPFSSMRQKIKETTKTKDAEKRDL